MPCVCLDTTKREKQTINIFWPVVYILIAAADWLAVYRGWKRVNYVTKPAVLLGLLLWFSLASGWEGRLFWFGMALVFSLAGDVLLLRPVFLAGLVAFLLAHVFYIVGFTPTSIPLTPLSVVFAVSAWGLATYQNRRLSAAVKKDDCTAFMQYPLFLYCLVISIMLLTALVTLARPEWPLTAAILAGAGGLLFVVSDFTLGENRFICRIPHGDFYVRITYHLAQLALVTGVLLRYAKI